MQRLLACRAPVSAGHTCLLNYAVLPRGLGRRAALPLPGGAARPRPPAAERRSRRLVVPTACAAEEEGGEAAEPSGSCAGGPSNVASTSVSTPTGPSITNAASSSSSSGNGGSGSTPSPPAPAPAPASSTSGSSGSGSGAEPPPRRQPRPQRPKQSWFERLREQFTLGSMVRLLFNGLAAWFLMRLWMPGRGGGLLGPPEPVTVQVAFSEFVRQARRNEVSCVVVDGATLTFVPRPKSSVYKMLPDTLDPKHLSFQTIRPGDYPTPYDLLLSNGVQVSAVDKGSTRLSNLLTYALSGLLLLQVLNRVPLKLPQRGTGRRHSSQQVASPVTFDDVAGVDEAKEELEEVVDYLRNPERFSSLGARPPSGVLLVGPPGTGKTLLARAVAGEADVPFFSISASEFVELYVGMGAMRVRDLFAQARKVAPAIVFIDEIDAVAKGRDSRLRSVGNDEREQTLNQLLTELDGFDGSDPTHPVICLAATNRPDVLDPALLRPGRFDRRVAVERPDRQGRLEILQVHVERKGLPLARDVDLPALAAQTTGFTGADLANLVNEAALLAARGNKAKVGYAEFDAAILRAVAGIEKKRSILAGVEKSVVARHEIGHALVSTAVAAVVPGAATVERLSIIPRSGGALGFTYIPPKSEDRALLFDSEIRGQLAMLMGGRAAEELTCEAVSTGAVDDIRRATDLAHKAVSEYGLSASVGPLSVGMLEAGGDEYAAVLKDGSTGIARLVEREVRLLCEGALAVAREVVASNAELHEQLSARLQQDERLEGEALQDWLHCTVVPEGLKAFVLRGEVPAAALARVDGRLVAARSASSSPAAPAPSTP